MRGGPWIWSKKIDLGVFLLPTIFAALLVLGARAVGFQGKTPEWAWLALILGVDVAHVWATLFRSYLDPPELRRRPWLYALVPLFCWLAGVALHHRSSLTFWRVLAYIAVFHFIRQQAGWIAIYRARAGQRGPLTRLLDDALIYLGTGVPVLIWHTRLPRPFSWFLDGDFLPFAALAPLVVPLQILLALVLLAWIAHHLVLLRYGGSLSAGKTAVALTTVGSWYGGIVLAQDDWAFTVLNVLPHGVPYFALLWAYGKARQETAPTTPGSRLVATGFGAFFGVLVLCAFVEELLWDRVIWHDRAWLFGFLPELDAGSVAHLLVPLLALPQATHYVLDAFLWRRGSTGPEQARALGFRTA